MEWISVKDQLPGISQKIVLVCRHDKLPAIAFFIHTLEGYYFCIGDDVKQTWEPEYWIQIPDQPERLSEKTSKEDAKV